MRLNRYLASCGVGSRRSVEPLIREGRVTIAGEICIDLSRQVEPGDPVAVDGKLLHASEPLTILLHKPRGIITTRDDPEKRETVYDLLPGRFRMLHHVGRLDLDSEGLLILTNQGDLSARLTHPGCGVEKEYMVTLDRVFDPAHTADLIKGVQIEGGLASAAAVKIHSRRRIDITLQQGMKRQIRLMADALGYRVRRLVRTRIDTLTLVNLKPGKWRVLHEDEVNTLLVAGEQQRRSKVE